MPEMLAGGEKHSCQLYLCEGIVSAVTKLEKKVKLLLYCTPKMYFFIADHQALTPEEGSNFLLNFSPCIVFPVFFLIGLWISILDKTK